jgi:hypothetical protein
VVERSRAPQRPDRRVVLRVGFVVFGFVPEEGVLPMKRQGMSILLCAAVGLVWLAATACSSGGGGDQDTAPDATSDIGADVQTAPDADQPDGGTDEPDGSGRDVVRPDVRPDAADPDTFVRDVPEDDGADSADVPPCTCEEDGDCAGWYDDLGECEWAACVACQCARVPAPTDVTCEDGNLCTVGDHCTNGTCVSGGPADCDDGQDCTRDRCDEAVGCVYETNHAACNDGNLCTTDTCVVGSGCTHTPRPGACDDGDACTIADQCNNGVCGGVARTCSDNNACNGEETCNPATGCVPGTPLVCRNGDYCDGVETCNPALGCVPGIPVDCDDGDPCTADSCDEAADQCVWVFEPSLEGCNAAPCTPETLEADCEDDGNICTIEECRLGYCYYRRDTTCTLNVCYGDIQCDDDDICTTDTCLMYTACYNVPVAGCPVDCRRTADCDDDNECTDERCVDGGICERFDNSNPCDDGNICTLADHCEGGECVGGSTLTCPADGDDCTLDSCQPAGGCTYPLDPACGLLPCLADQDCEDGNSCTAEFCNLAGGYCQVTVRTGLCDDGDACTVNEFCTGGVCGGGLPRPCDDQQPCTLDLCNSVTGCYFQNDPTCRNQDCQTGDDCDDGDTCTIDTCVPFLRACYNTPRAGCGPCTTDAQCNDNDPCTFDVCGAGRRCEHPIDVTCGATPCDSNDDCDDEDDCTLDFCDRQQGYCVNPIIPTCGEPCDSNDDCHDGDACTEDICDSSTDVCVIVRRPDCQYCGGPQDCQDGNFCTDDTCPDGACRFVPNSRVCDDADACTMGDVCTDGECVGRVRTCDDSNPCTADICHPLYGCLNEYDITLPGCNACFSSADCDDGDPCTEDVCGSLICVHSELPYCTRQVCVDESDCNDGDACTIDACDRLSNGACFNYPVSPCEVDIPCATDEDCADTSPCTETSCGASGFCLVVPHLPCGKQCFGAEDCDDGAACTVDRCEPDVGCVYVDNGTCLACEDDGDCAGSGNACVLPGGCAETGVCGGGQLAPPGTDCDNRCLLGAACDGQGGCTLGTTVSCPPPEACELASCDPAVGCVYRPDSTNPRCNCDSHSDCNDGDPCTEDICFDGGRCKNVALRGAACTSAACTTGGDCSDGNVCTFDVCQPQRDICLHFQNDDCTNTACAAPSDCADGNECTVDVCDTTCSWEPNTMLRDCVPFEPCTADADCVTGYHECSTPPGSTQEVCTFHPDLCSAGLCTDIGCVFAARQGCSSDQQCDTSLDCPSGACPLGGGRCYAR